MEGINKKEIIERVVAALKREGIEVAAHGYIGNRIHFRIKDADPATHKRARLIRYNVLLWAYGLCPKNEQEKRSNVWTSMHDGRVVKYTADHYCELEDYFVME